VTTSKQGIDGESASSRERESEASAEEREFELIARKPSLQLHQEDSDKHVKYESERDQTGQKAYHQSDTAKELEQRDERSCDAWERDAHLCERAGNAGKTIGEQLLSAVSHENRRNCDPNRRKPEAQQTIRGRTKEKQGVVGRMVRPIEIAINSLKPEKMRTKVNQNGGKMRGKYERYN
jgi:hypothetical protein